MEVCLVIILSLVCAHLCFKNEIYVLHVGPTVCKT